MERLSEKRHGQNVIPLRQDGANKWALCSAGMGEAPAQYLYGDHADRLASYEDTGLEPEEVEIMRGSKADAQFMLTELCRLCDYDRLEELAKAEKDGRLVVLPCKVGDTVWFRTYTNNGAVDLGIQPHEVTAIRGYAIAKGEYTDVGLIPAQYGVSWFLTREEAEAALAGMNVGNIVKVTDLYDEDGGEITEAANE